MVGEVRLPEDVEAGDGAHQVVVDPESPHGVVGSWVDPHRDLVWVLVGDPLVHIEEVPVPLPDRINPVAPDRVIEIEVDPTSTRSDTTPDRKSTRLNSSHVSISYA